MSRSARIVSVAVATGALAACSIAGLAAVNAALSARNDPGRSMAVASAASVATSAPPVTASLPPISSTPLELPVIDTGVASGPAADPTRAAAPSSPEVRARDARAAVLAAAGGVALSTSRVQHGGYAAWAVEVLRDDGSIVVGYVDRVGGAVYDWTVRRPAATATPSTATSSAPTSAEHSSDDDGDSHDSDDD